MRSTDTMVAQFRFPIEMVGSGPLNAQMVKEPT